MKLTHLKLWSLFFVIASMGFAAEIGKPAPGFSLTATNGKKVDLSALKGKVVVLEWFNDDCPYVKKHYGAGNMQKLQKEFTAKGVTWLTVLSSAPGKQGFADAKAANGILKGHHAANTATLLDPQGTLGKSYDAKTTPHMFVIDKQGLLAYQGAIDDNSSSDAAVIPTSKNYVSEALTAVLAGKPVAEASTKPYGCGVKYE